MVDQVMSEEELHEWLARAMASPAFRTPPPTFDKAPILHRHNATAAMNSLMAKSRLHITTLNLSRRGEPASVGQPESLARYKSILLPDLKLDRVHRGRVLYGTLIAAPFRISSLMTVIEDRQGCACVATIPSVSISEADIPINSKVAVLEPYFKLAMDGSPVIRIDDPARLVRIDDISEVVAVRLEGNAWFAAKKWQEAVDSYTRCIAACSRLLGVSPGESVGKEEVEGVLLPALTNRAEARLRLGEAEEALVDCNAALAIDGGHVKSLYRKGRALVEMNKAEMAIRWLSKAAEKEPGNQEIAEHLDKARAAAARALESSS